MRSIRLSVCIVTVLLPSLLLSQSVTLELVPSSLDLSACPGEPLYVTVHLSNPSKLEVGGYQAFLRFPAEYFEAVRYEPFVIKGLFKTGGREPFGGGYEPCSAGTTDAWGDLVGEDVVSVVASGYGTGSPSPFKEADADLGRFVFTPRGKLTGSEGVRFRSNEETCNFPLDQTTDVFSPQGHSLESGTPSPFTITIHDSGPFVTNFLCSDTDDSVTLTWTAPSVAGVGGYRIFRNGVQIASYPIPAVSRHVDSSPPSGIVRYEIAVLRQGGAEGCRDECTIERQARFVRGDANGDGVLTITDPVTILSHLFQGSAIRCEDAADADDDGSVLLTDAVRVLGRLFQGQPPLPAPYPSPGSDPTPDNLTCGN